MTEPHDPQQPADRAPYEAPVDETRPYASPAGPPPPFPPQGPPQQGGPVDGPPPPPARHGLVSRRTLAATGAAALVVGGVVGGLIGWASTDTAQPVRTTVAETQTPDSTHAQQGEHARKSRGVAGTITAINGSTWTIQTTQGDPFTVTIGSDTKFGTAKAPAQASDFAVGDRIVATGTRSGTTVEATRVVKRVARTAPSSGGASTTAPS
ncbi:DUF5666 domain-containing protein [Williamsia serinedens]|uniref:DUF5666 domain-containing protein n=1 Tax=Williamsia serinedens TaxID=391736 RepID=A0ABT1H4Q2_9NOCA|nr:DUF5666 domain-containing protein [Williamsia serinedens]MCP2162161.1 hypothetical protein [Williamsia serinedens]